MSRSESLRVVVAVLSFSLPALAQDGESPRQRMMKHLGIEARPQPKVEAIDAGIVLAAPASFESIRPILQRRCASCHRTGGRAASSGWLLRDVSEVDEAATKQIISQVLPKGTGARAHGGGAAIAAGSAEAEAIAAWIATVAEPPVETISPRVTRSNAPMTVEQVLERHCAGCHQAGGSAARSGWLLTEVWSVDAVATRRVADVLLDKATGHRAHGGGAVITRDSPEYGVIAKWVASVLVPVPAPRVEAPVSEAVESPDAGATSFDAVHALLNTHCASCHGEGEMAGTSRYQTNSNQATHLASLESVRGIVAQRAQGEGHSGGEIFAAGSRELQTLTQWLGTPSPEPVAAGPAAPAPAPPPAVEAGFIWARLPVLGTFRLNGRFDLSLERTGYNTNPFASTAQTGLQSYHHFLFLSRESANDPFTISVEVTSLQFWHVGVRISPESWPVQLTAKAGKLLVPFGGEPLYHHSYGGTAGFDQRVLPPIFAREGFSLSLAARTHGFAFTADVYLIAGYGLRAVDAVLNLQADLTPLDAIHPAVGGRVGAAYGPFSVWYSGLINPLGFDRNLFMQSVDVAIFRPKIKVLEYFSFGVGLLRADVSGGGAGVDYFHFASYFEVRAYPTEWLYVQYRQGLRTFNNRRGVFIDETRLTQQDSSTHNVGIVARWRGLSVGLYQFFNFEKVDETPNDVTRLMVAYDF